VSRRVGRVAALGRAAVLGCFLASAASRSALRLAAARVRRDSEPAASILGRTVAELLQALGPTYVKVGQILSVRRDVFGEDFTKHLRPLQDDLPPIPFEQVPARFRRELEVELADVVAELDEVPLASAGVSSVYRGRLRDGRSIALKVRRPGIARQVAADLRVLRAGAALLERLPPLRLVPMRAAVDDFGACVERQLDFRLEALSNRRLRLALASHEGIVIPRVIEELSGESILTMELIPGVARAEGALDGHARGALLAALRALYAMIFVEGFFHCDLHPGNLHLLADGRAALVDFGFMGEFCAADRVKFAEFFLALARNDGARCAEIAVEMASSRSPSLDYPAFEAEIASLVGQAAERSARDFEVAGFVLGLFEAQRSHGVRSTTAFTMAIVSLLVFEGLAKQVYPDLDFQREARPFVLRALR
jgi:ubiquinone biosynthesis protein